MEIIDLSEIAKKINDKMTPKEREEEQALWCNCGYEGEESIYVENHLGVRHGWVCPKCHKYTQIG